MARPDLGARSSCCSAIDPGRTPPGSSCGLSGLTKWPQAHAIRSQVYFLVFRGTVGSLRPVNILGRHATGYSLQGREQGVLCPEASVSISVAGSPPGREGCWATPARQVRGFAAGKCRPAARAVDRQTAHRSLDSGGPRQIRRSDPHAQKPRSGFNDVMSLNPEHGD